MQRALWISCLSLGVAGCQLAPGPMGPPTPAVGVPMPAEGGSEPRAGTGASPTSRGLALKVRGPADLAQAAALLPGAGMVAAGAGNLTATSDGVLSHNGGALVAAVDGARCHCEALDGTHLGPSAITDATGDAGFPALPLPQEPIVAAAHFYVAGQEYRVAALVPAAGPDGPLVVDPISTMIAAVAHDAASRRPDAEVLAAASLARIREICERHGLSADADDLAFPATAESSAEGLRRYWAEEVEEHVTDPRDREALAAFTQALAEIGR